MWITVAAVYAILYHRYAGIDLAAHRVFFQNSLVGLISSTAAFFVLEQVLQKSLVPRLFPHRGLYKTPGIARIRIGKRLAAFIIAVNLTRPLRGIISVLKLIRKGNLRNRVTVTTSDEIRYAGDVINEMTIGLRERDRMKHSLELAREVQHNLLPQKVPTVKGIDLAGISLY